MSKTKKYTLYIQLYIIQIIVIVIFSYIYNIYEI